MQTKWMITEERLGEIAKASRLGAKKSKATAGRELNVSRMTIHQAEECPEVSLTKLRRRIIDRYSGFNVVGPFFMLERKKRSRRALPSSHGLR
jgi:hypothetical protein